MGITIEKNSFQLFAIHLIKQEKIINKTKNKRFVLKKQLITKNYHIIKNTTNTNLDNATLKNVIFNQNADSTFGNVSFQIDIDESFSDENVKNKIIEQENFQIKLKNEIKNLQYIAIYGVVLVASLIFKKQNN